jgi:hypothetical protein
MAVVGIGLVGSQAGHLLAFQLRFGSAAFVAFIELVVYFGNRKVDLAGAILMTLGKLTIAIAAIAIFIRWFAAERRADEARTSKPIA